MPIDYTVYLGLGRQIPINYNMFPYREYNDLEEEFQAMSKFQIIITSQEYKGHICGCTIFVGKLLCGHDLRHTTTYRVVDTVERLQTGDFSDDEMSTLDDVCAAIKEKLGLDEDFGDYGVNMIVHCW